MRHMTGIPDMKYPKGQLLEKLKSNRDEHVVKFGTALVAYREATTAACKKLLEMVEKDENVDHSKVLAKLQRPENHVKHYDRVIQMLELTSDAEIELSQEVFTQIVLDDWDWKSRLDAIISSNSSYL